MTYFKTALVSAAALAVAAPALADHHGDKKQDADAQHTAQTMMETNTQLREGNYQSKVPMTDSDAEMMKKKKSKMHDRSDKAMMDTDYQRRTTMTEAETQTEVRGAVEMNSVKMNDTVGEVLQADGEPSIQSDEDIIVMDDTVNENAFRAADDDGMVADNAIVVPGSNDTVSTVTCPAGTTAQADMTCLITGDYEPEITD